MYWDQASKNQEVLEAKNELCSLEKNSQYISRTFSQKNVSTENKLIKTKERAQFKAHKGNLKPSTISHGRQISIHGNPNSYLGT